LDHKLHASLRSGQNSRVHTNMANRFFDADAPAQTCRLDALTTDEFLTLVGQRIRFHRTSSRMSRKRLAEVSGVSERYLAQLEAGQGNMSIALLRKVTAAIGLPLNILLADVEGEAVAEEEVAELS